MEIWHIIVDMTWRWRLAQFFELWWWKNYLHKKNADDYRAWKITYWKNLLAPYQTLLNLSPQSSIADFGCGPAGVFMLFDKNSVQAIDPLLEQYQNALHHFRKEDYPNVRFVPSTIEEYAGNEQFDIIFCMNAINHVQDINKSYDVLCRHLKHNGTLVMSVDAHNHTLCKFLFRLIPGDILHPHQYDLPEYQKFLTDRNLTIIKTELVKTEFFFNHYLLIAKPGKQQLP